MLDPEQIIADLGLSSVSDWIRISKTSYLFACQILWGSWGRQHLRGGPHRPGHQALDAGLPGLGPAQATRRHLTGYHNTHLYDILAFFLVMLTKSPASLVPYLNTRQRGNHFVSDTVCSPLVQQRRGFRSFRFKLS